MSLLRQLQMASPMPDYAELKRTARLYRRMASVPTEGGHNADRWLLALAEQLENEAVEEQSPKSASSLAVVTAKP